MLLRRGLRLTSYRTRVSCTTSGIISPLTLQLKHSMIKQSKWHSSSLWIVLCHLARRPATRRRRQSDCTSVDRQKQRKSDKHSSRSYQVELCTTACQPVSSASSATAISNIASSPLSTTAAFREERRGTQVATVVHLILPFTTALTPRWPNGSLSM